MKSAWKILTTVLLLALTGCSSFERDWRHACVQPPPQSGALTGAWKGTWLSEVNGHTGELRCLVTANRPDEYEFHFKATFWKIFRYSYTVNLPVTPTAEGYAFKGQEDLGFWSGGVYHYDGQIGGTNLNATYSNKFDHGVFTLQRPTGGN